MLENIDMTTEGDVLTIRIDLSKPGRPSKNPRRKTNIVVASTNGTFPVLAEGGGVRQESINLSVWRKPTEDEVLEHGLWRETDR